MTIETVRWGDQQRILVPNGSVLRSSEMFRVTSPFPTVWRVIARIEASNPAVTTLTLFVGIGSVMKEYPFPAPVGTTLSFEIPGQSISALYQSLPVAADTNFFLDASIAPLTPWKGLEVKLSR